MFGDVFLPAKRKPKSTKPAQKRHALKATGKKRLSPTKLQRRSKHAALEARLGYKIPKLSDVVGKKGTSRHSVRKRITDYDVKSKDVFDERQVLVKDTRGYFGYREPDRWVTRRVKVGGEEISRISTGERLVVSKRRTKNRKERGGGKRGEGQVQKGTMASKRSKAKTAKSGARRGGKKGGKAGREPKKKGK
mgnify:CR=1 FL=1